MAEKKYLVEYTEWLDSELTRRYRTSQESPAKSKGRNALADAFQGEVKSGVTFSFSVTVEKRAWGYVAVLETGFIYAFNNRFAIPILEETITEDSDLYLILEIDFELQLLNSHRPLIVKSGRHVDYLYKMPEEDSSRYEYAYLIATVYNSEKAENSTPNWLVHQYQLGDIVLPFRADYVPEIDPSLAPLIAIDEKVKAPFVNLKLQDKIEEGAPKEESDVFLNQKSGVLEWDEVPANSGSNLKIHQSLSKLLEINSDGELSLAPTVLEQEGSRAGKVLAVDSTDSAVEWITVEGGGATLGVITSGGGSAGTATWQPVIVSSDGSYTVDTSAPAVSVIIPRF